MTTKTIHSENGHECLFLEQFRSLDQCKFYDRRYLLTGEKEKPPYCRVKNITVEEGEIIEDLKKGKSYGVIIYQKKCFLCGTMAEHEEFAGGRKLARIKCPHCTEYRISRKAIIHYFGKSKILNDEDKKKISEYLISNYGPENKTNILKGEHIKNITGK